jgi:GWxTD domain-containing protein
MRLAVASLILVASCAAAAPVDQSLTVRGGVVVYNRPAFDTVSLVEFPFVLTRGEYDFFQPDSASGTLFARIFAQVNVYGVDGLIVDSATTYFSAAAADSADARRPDYSLFNSLVLILRPGLYSARIVVIDAVSKRQGECFIDRINVDAPVQDRLSMGGKCLAYQVAYVGNAPGSGIGVPKNGYEVRCNPTGVYSVHDTAASYYAEVYNLKYDPNTASDFVVSAAVLDAAGAPYRQLGSRSRPKAGATAVIAESFPIAGWPVGTYVLEVTVTDPGSGEEISHDFPFYIVTPVEPAAVDTSPEAAEHDLCDALDLETQLRLVKYLLTPPEEAVLKNLAPEGQLSYIRRFWKERDPDPATPALENCRTMYERYLYVNQFYSLTEEKTDGWSTDRGRVMMIYGQPDKLEDYSHLASGYPYQVWWYYSLVDGAVFVFQDRRGFGEFRLVHSNYPGELYRSEWDAALKAGTLPTD